MGLRGDAAIVGAAQYKPEKYATAPQMFHLEQVADLAAQALEDAGLKASDLDGLVINGPQFHEASVFVPAMAAEYLGIELNFARSGRSGRLYPGGHGLACRSRHRDGPV